MYAKYRPSYLFVFNWITCHNRPSFIWWLWFALIVYYTLKSNNLFKLNVRNIFDKKKWKLCKTLLSNIYIYIHIRTHLIYNMEGPKLVCQYDRGALTVITSIGLLCILFNCRLVWNEKTHNFTKKNELFEWDMLMLHPCWINTSHLQFHRDAKLLATSVIGSMVNSWKYNFIKNMYLNISIYLRYLSISKSHNERRITVISIYQKKNDSLIFIFCYLGYDGVFEN